MTMAATAPWEDGGTAFTKADGQAFPSSPFYGSLSATQLAAEIGHCLRSQHAGAGAGRKPAGAEEAGLYDP